MTKQDTAAVSDCGGFSFFHDAIDFARPVIMGVLNVTPDSFSDGGVNLSVQAAVARGLEMVEQGASFIDIGGESTRPGANAVPVEHELERVIPVIEALKAKTSALISVDTSSPEVMDSAYRAGAHLINDVRALQKPGAIEVCAKLPIPICLMHMKGEPDIMQNNPCYHNVVEQVIHFLQRRILICEQAGISKDRLMIDPGFGFGKSLDHNLTLLKNLRQFKRFNLPILVGMSRKSMIGQVLEKPVDQRLVGSLAAAVIAAMNGANIIRVHDVAETVEAIKMTTAVMRV